MLVLMLAAAAGMTVTFGAQNSPYGGVCPAMLKFAGTISGAPNATVKYVFNRTILGVTTTSPPVTAQLDRAGQLRVSDSISISSSQSGSDALQIIGGGAAAASFVVACAPAAKPNTTVKTTLFLTDEMYTAANPNPSITFDCSLFSQPLGHNKIRGTLKAAFAAEKAYMQEKDVFGKPDMIGFQPGEPALAACVRFDFRLGHYDGDRKNTVFLTTAQLHSRTGPMWCVTSEWPNSGRPNISTAGGPISLPSQCALLPEAPQQ